MIPGADREDESVEDQVARGQAVLLREQRVGSLGDGELPLARHRHALLLVLVDAADDDRPAILLQQRDHLLEALLAVLQVDGVDDGLALALPERELDDRGVGRVDHQRDFHLLGDEVHEAVHVGRLVAVGIGEADVHHLAAPLHLRPADLGGFLELLLDDQLLELLRPDDVRPLTHDHRAVVVGRIEHLDSAHRGRARSGRAARGLAFHQSGEGAGVGRRRAAAAPDQVHPALVDEAAHLEGQALRGLFVVAVLVGQAGVRVDRHEACGDLREGPQVVGHELGTRGAVEPDREEPEVLDRRVERVHALAGEHGAHRLDGAAHHEGQLDSGFGHGAVEADGRRLDVERVLRGLEEKRVHAALDQRAGLCVVALEDPVEGDVGRDGDRAGPGPHRPDRKARRAIWSSAHRPRLWPAERPPK